MKYILNPEIMCVINGNSNFLYNRKTRKRYSLNSRYVKMFENPKELFEKDLELQGIQQLLREKIIVEDQQSEDKCSVRYLSDNNIVNIQLELLTSCNFQCIHCYLKEEPRNYYAMPLKKVYNIVDQAAELGVINFDITGGEPLLCKNLKKILRYIYKKGMKTILFTNGLLINKEWISYFAEIGIDGLRISLDGLEYSHNYIRGNDCFQQIINNITMAAKEKIPIHISTTAMKENVSELYDLIDFLREKKEIIHSIDTYLPFESEDADRMIRPQEYAKIVKYLMREGISKNNLDIEEYCGIGKNYFFISADGVCKLCPTFPQKYSLGNVFDMTLGEIAKKVGEYKNINCKESHNCIYFPYCKGGCRSRALLLENDICGKDKYMCKVCEEIKGQSKL